MRVFYSSIRLAMIVNKEDFRKNIVLSSIGIVLLSGMLLGQTAPGSQAQTGTNSAGDLYTKASPAVVLIELKNEKGEVTGSGSGFLVSADGKILTNYHVVAHTKKATVRLANDDAYDDVEVLELDKRKDIALIKIKAVELPYLALGHSNAAAVGDTVYTLGTPLGMLQNTLSQGIVSGLRQGDGYRLFQITAPISHGSSGGPLFNGKGEVIGITALTFGDGQNLNFAIPIDYAKGMLPANQPHPLASIYEPEPEAEKPSATAAAATKPAESKEEAHAPPAVTPGISEEMKKSSFVYLETKLGIWTKEAASKELGEPLRRRDNASIYPAEIYAYSDPTKAWREFELSFDTRSTTLHDIYAYPWRGTWDECKQLWGSNEKTIKNSDGTRFHAYRDRRINVLVDKQGQVISIGTYWGPQLK